MAKIPQSQTDAATNASGGTNAQIYDVFVSYARVDQPWAKQLAEAIQTASAEMSSGPWRVFLDTEEMDGSDFWRKRLLGEIEKCASFLAVLSPAYMTSYNAERMCFHEYETAAHRELRGEKVLVQALYEQGRFTIAMERKQWRNFEGVSAAQIASHPEFHKLLRDLDKVIAATRSPTAIVTVSPAAPPPPQPSVAAASSESSVMPISGPARVLLEKMEKQLHADDRDEVKKSLVLLCRLLPATHPELHGWQALVDHWRDEEAAAEAQRQAQAERERRERAEAERVACEKAEAARKAQEERERKAREEAEAAERMWRTAQIVTNSIGMQLRLIRAGKFVMGDKEQDDNPPHTVTLTKDFRIGVFPVTNAQFRQFRPKHDSGKLKGHSLNGDDQPVVNISWNDAKEFCEWLTIREGRTYRLPTEAKWEYCCRAGRSNELSKYPWGPNWPPHGKAGNYRDATAARVLGLDSPIEGYDDGYAVTSPVGQFDPNPWGLFDMGGNVWEWCLDAYDPGFCKRDATDPLQESGSSRVLRGASWCTDYRDYLQAASRLILDPSDRSGDFGFRVVVC